MPETIIVPEDDVGDTVQDLIDDDQVDHLIVTRVDDNQFKIVIMDA
jgi:hypothetical protein